MWIIDASGTKDDVTKAITALTYDSFVKVAADQLDIASAHVKVQRTIPRGKPGEDQLVAKLEDEAVAKAKVAALSDPDEKACFERVKAYVLTEVAACKTAFVGVTARPLAHPAGVGGGRISIDVSEYEKL